MNTENLHKLKDLAKDLSLLYVEDSLTLQKQVGRFLEKIFDKFYQAYDGDDGFRKYKTNKPDIILTDLTMPRKTGLEMIIEIKHHNPNAKIVVLSAHNDDSTLLQTVDMGIIDFILKPVDMDKLISSLIKAIQGHEECEKLNQTMHDLKIFKEQNTHIDFINSYKGMPIQSTGLITEVKEDQFIAKVQHMQILAMKNEKYSVIELKATNRHIKVTIESIDEENDLIVLSDPEYINFTLREFKYKRVKVDGSFKIGLNHKSHVYDIQPLDASFISISMIVNDDHSQLKLNDEVDITLGFDVAVNNNVLSEKKFTKLFSSGKIIRIEQTSAGLVVVMSIKIKKSDESSYNRYLKEREIEILREFKSLMLKKK